MAAEGPPAAVRPGAGAHSRRPARRWGRVDERIGPGSRSEDERAAARQEGFGRLAVEGHDADVLPLYFNSNDIALEPIDEAKSQAFIGAHRNVQPCQPIDGVNRLHVLWIDAGRDHGAVGAQAPVFDQKHLVPIDGDGAALLDYQCPRARWPRLTIAKQPKVAQEGAPVTQWNHEGLLGP